MRFRVEEVSGKPRPVFLGRNTLRKSLLTHFLPYTSESVINLLQEISWVEIGRDTSAYFNGGMIDGEIYRDRVVIEYLEPDGSGNYPKVEIPLEEVKLMLFEWGTALQRWRVKKSKLKIHERDSLE